MEEGYTKYLLHHQPAPAPDLQVWHPLAVIRQRLYHLGLIGSYPNGIGYGNLSCRLSTTPLRFLISGTRTGGLPKLSGHHFAEVYHATPATNELWAAGPIAASSEAMSHWALYAADARIHAVLHVHHAAAWSTWKDHYPTTDDRIPYGCPELCQALQDKLSDRLGTSGILVMGGHEEGLICYGPSLEVAYQLLTEDMEREGWLSPA